MLAIVVQGLHRCALFITIRSPCSPMRSSRESRAKDSRRRREIPAEQRHQIYAMIATVYPLAAGYIVFLAIAPFGQRDTIISFLIVPFLIVVPVGRIAAAVTAAASDGDLRTITLNKHQGGCLLRLKADRAHDLRSIEEAGANDSCATISIAGVVDLISQQGWVAEVPRTCGCRCGVRPGRRANSPWRAGSRSLRWLLGRESSWSRGRACIGRT